MNAIQPRKKDVTMDGQLGATPISSDQTLFRVWAPLRERVEVESVSSSQTRKYSLTRDDSGYFSGTAPIRCGHQYRYVLDDGVSRPDPVSRYQPNGVHGASQVVDHQTFRWSDDDWPGIAKRDLIIYELHIGTFTEQGTFQAAIQRIPELVELGVTAVELMPVAQSPGRWNWGYDGVNLFAVRNSYGTPDDFKTFVDSCHTAGLAVFLDVVYNHLGPEGNYLSDFGPYFSKRHRTPWGEALNFDGQHAEHVRRFVVDNAIEWLDNYHLDGLRLDAVHFMLDDSPLTILDDVRQAVTKFSANTQQTIHLIAEANVFDRDLLTENSERTAYDATWCDCLMHSIYTSGVPELHLAHRPYEGAADLAEVLAHGYLYEHRDGKPIRISRDESFQVSQDETKRSPLASFVTALQTHDGVGNHPHGKRIHHLTSKSFQRAAAAITLLYPGIPLIFMGEESATDAPFPFLPTLKIRNFAKPSMRDGCLSIRNMTGEARYSPRSRRHFTGRNVAILNAATHR